MAALWLQSSSLLLLLVLSWTAFQAVASPQHLCGSELVDALLLVCGDRGLFKKPTKYNDPLQDLLAAKSSGAKALGSENEVAEYAFKDQMEMLMKRSIVKRGTVERGIVERCCYEACTLSDLEVYCNSEPRLA